MSEQKPIESMTEEELRAEVTRLRALEARATDMQRMARKSLNEEAEQGTRTVWDVMLVADYFDCLVTGVSTPRSANVRRMRSDGFLAATRGGVYCFVNHGGGWPTE